MGLWVLALSHSCAVLTDGHVSRARAAALAGPDAAELAERLCAAGLWHRADEPCADPNCDANRKPVDGWRFHAWADYQPTREAVESDRKRKQEAGREGGQRKAASRKLAGASRLPAEAAKQNAGTLPGKSFAPDPSRPDPEITHTPHAREATPDDPTAASVLAALRSHRALADVATVQAAEWVAGRLMSRPRPFAHVEQAIADAARDAEAAELAGNPWGRERAAKMLARYIDHAKPPRDDAPHSGTRTYAAPEPVRTGTRLLTFDDPPRAPRPPRAAPTTDATVPGDALALVANIGLGGRS